MSNSSEFIKIFFLKHSDLKCRLIKIRISDETALQILNKRPFILGIFEEDAG